LDQLEQFIRPLQPQRQKQQEQSNIPRSDQLAQRLQLRELLPTLLSFENEETERREAESLAEEQTRRQQQQINRSPPRRLNEMVINTLRRRYSDGELTREAAVTIIQGQPPAIQRIIVPDFHYPNQEQLQQSIPPITQPRIAPVQPQQRINRQSLSRLNGMLNIYRRRDRDGLLTREDALATTWGQPLDIKRIVVESSKTNSNWS